MAPILHMAFQAQPASPGGSSWTQVWGVAELYWCPRSSNKLHPPSDHNSPMSQERLKGPSQAYPSPQKAWKLARCSRSSADQCSCCWQKFCNAAVSSPHRQRQSQKTCPTHKTRESIQRSDECELTFQHLGVLALTYTFTQRSAGYKYPAPSLEHPAGQGPLLVCISHAFNVRSHSKPSTGAV
ncbi:hypothetical protein DSO57_1016729 [Entomophthora muscae]|uniref:Uncharacterized protein n=1 Tax=Entomophthora muscae TaxID=34485 RepID=A0ACC2RVW7_9FUNG|nr:hypothetical protein DSO57_1016729 [Entomophthora muscae]